MTTSFPSLFLTGLLFSLVLFVVALPLVWAFDPDAFRRWFRDRAALGGTAGGILGGAALIAFLLKQGGDITALQDWGRTFGRILHVLIAVDFLILMPQLLILVWPKAGAVALASFRECIRQPMFWLVAILATLLIIMSMVIPYFTFGEDYKMMKQLGFDAVMLAAALFGLLAASISIHEEIEGRTAITVMSKPINRRQFLIGKYLGILLACWAMTLLLGFVLTWALSIKASGLFDRLDDVKDTMSLEVQQAIVPHVQKLVPSTEGQAVVAGAAIWLTDAAAHHLGMLLNFGQVMILLAICTALATRMSFVVNLSICLVVFLIGHLAPTLVQVTSSLASAPDASPALKLVDFLAQLFNSIFPALEYFDMGPTIIRDQAVPMKDFSLYVLTVFGYSVLYTAIAMIVGLILFEDRDLA